jgi:cobalt/nickel transport protein
MMNKRIIYFVLFTLILAIFVSPFASSKPDGLERVAHDLGFIENEKSPLYEVFPDYSLAFIPIEYISTAFSGLLGLCIIAILTLASLWLVRKVNRT